MLFRQDCKLRDRCIPSKLVYFLADSSFVISDFWWNIENFADCEEVTSRRTKYITKSGGFHGEPVRAGGGKEGHSQRRIPEMRDWCASKTGWVCGKKNVLFRCKQRKHIVKTCSSKYDYRQYSNKLLRSKDGGHGILRHREFLDWDCWRKCGVVCWII